MPPKKRERDGESSKQPRTDHIQADHELFLQAFEKPTQIYRFLRTRNMLSPIFLTRNLLYMPQRQTRRRKIRQDFKIDSLLDRVLSKGNEIPTTIVAGYMTLTFLGFYDKTSRDACPQTVQVETHLVKICHKKRKDSSSPTTPRLFGIAEVPVNPSDDTAPPLAPTVSIPTHSFSLSNGPLVKSYLLVLRVQPQSSLTNNANYLIDEEPALKRRKSSNNNICNNTNIISTNSNNKSSFEAGIFYMAELIVYDKYNRCLLTDGDYELGLQEAAKDLKNSPKKHSSWEYFSDIGVTFKTLDSFKSHPMLKFKLCWTQEPCRELVDRPKLFSVVENKENIPQISASNNNVVIKQEDRLQVVYQFVYNNNSKQQTEPCEDLHCPWCSVNCLNLYSLLKHLKLCHPRFTFTYVPINIGARIDVAINELFDGSYMGSPHDLISQPYGCAFSRNGPVRRSPVTHILVCRPKRNKPNLSEFLELEDAEYDGQRPYITGHSRLYHHTTTCLPVYPKEMDMDSEGENDPEWLRAKTMMMIDEFTDVNEGEKELMKMWNLHVMKFGYVGDCQIPLACSMFIQHKGKDLLLKNLYRNFVVHMCSLFDFGLISPVTLYNTMKKLQDLVGETGPIRKVLKDSHDAQMDHWAKVGIHQQQPTQERVTSVAKTPTVGRKASAPGSGHPRRKGNASAVELPLRRKSAAGESSRKRLSLTLKKEESQAKTTTS